jgi:hypothetical protein
MTGAEWIAAKLNSAGEFPGVEAIIDSKNVVFVQRSDKPDAYIGIIPTTPQNSTPVVSLDTATSIHAEKPTMSMMIAVPKGARWSGDAMSWLQFEGIAFGGVGDLLSAINYDEEISTHRNKTLAFVDDGLRRHSHVADLEWIDSKKVEIRLRNDETVIVALDNSYDITMSVARDAARILGEFDILLKTNPNGSITSNGAESVARLGFETMKWGELFGHLAKRSR